MEIENENFFDILDFGFENILRKHNNENRKQN